MPPRRLRHDGRAALLALAAGLTLATGIPRPTLADDDTSLRTAPDRPDAPANDDTLRVTSVLVAARGASGGRSPVFTDAVLARIAAGDFVPPREGDTFLTPEGEERVWRRVTANADGWIDDDESAGGYVFATLDVPRGGRYVLEARGHRWVIIDGEPRAGDPYNLGFLVTPVHLRAGRIELLFRRGRGALRATFVRPPAPVFVDSRDPVLPDVVGGVPETVAGLVVVNTTDEWRRGLVLVADAPAVGISSSGSSRPFTLPPASSRKIPAGFRVDPAPAHTDTVQLGVRLLAAHGDAAMPLHTRTFDLRVREPDQKHTRTFVSAIDGGVQLYGVTPPPGAPVADLGLVITCHGAGVFGPRQANVYEPRDWAYIVAPTNRRPFGFDWEDWGRMDALEVLEIARRTFRTDPSRTWLTGHSMGGHGTWHLGALLPDRFAAIGPCAGWRDFWSYGSGAEWDPDDPVADLLSRSANGSRLGLVDENLSHVGVYVFHGDADDNVPVTEARAMRERLGQFHPNFAYREYPGGSHWWGDESTDWPPLLEFLRGNVIPDPAGVRDVRFITVNPGVSARCDWLTIEAQVRSLLPSRVEAALDPDSSTLVLTTENVRRLTVDLAHLDARPSDDAAAIDVVLNGTSLGDVPWIEDGPTLRIDDVDDEPSRVVRFDRGGKSPGRSGPLKEAFRNGMLFVVGTRGTDEETAWAMAKARYDAETFAYRGNGAIEVLLDSDFDPDETRDRNVVLYGHEDVNGAWDQVLDDCPVRVRRGSVRVGGHRVSGDDLACLFVRPRRDSDVASVAVVAATGLPGAWAATFLPVFVSGVGFPDWIVIGADMLERGVAGVRGAGFFTADWDVGEDAAWR